MQANQKLLSDLTTYLKYSKYMPSEKRRENYGEITDRYLNMMFERYPAQEELISKYAPFLYRREVLPSMRALQFAGPAILKNEARGYNCSYLPIDNHAAFGELMQLLLGGTGVGYSVQKFHVARLPRIRQPESYRKFLIGDSIEGWSDAVKQLMKSRFGLTRTKPRFDYSDIREKGARLITAGGKAPGPEPLKICLTKIEALLDRKKEGELLSTLEVHDICCYIADAVLAGGIRRAALISLFSMDDIEMMTCKHGAWWELNPQRGRANNSVVLHRPTVTREEFNKVWDIIKDGKSGEPGIYFTNDLDYGTNPCAEISLRPFSFCNLTEINGSCATDPIKSEQLVKAATFFGTLQAGFTDFHYLRDDWRKATEKDALIGVGITGIAGNPWLAQDANLRRLAEASVSYNRQIAEAIGINPAARNTTVKPSGTTSCVLGTSSGIHSWHAEYYIRNMQCTVGDDLWNYMTKNHPRLIKEMDFQPGSGVIGIPQKAPAGAILRDNETFQDQVDRITRFNVEWVKPGSVSGPNTNNVSATVSLRPDEWDPMGEWMWENRETFNGLAVLPFDGGTYRDAPFMHCNKETYDDLYNYIQENPIDFSKIEEEFDNTSQAMEAACAGGECTTSF